MFSTKYKIYTIFSNNMTTIIPHIHQEFEYLNFTTFKNMIFNDQIVQKYNIDIYSVKSIKTFWIPKIKIRVDCGHDYYNITFRSKNIVQMFIQLNDILFLFNYKLEQKQNKMLIEETMKNTTINMDLISVCHKQHKQLYKGLYLNKFIKWVDLALICSKIKIPIKTELICEHDNDVWENFNDVWENFNDSFVVEEATRKVARKADKQINKIPIPIKTELIWEHDNDVWENFNDSFVVEEAARKAARKADKQINKVANKLVDNIFEELLLEQPLEQPLEQELEINFKYITLELDTTELKIENSQEKLDKMLLFMIIFTIIIKIIIVNI